MSFTRAVDSVNLFTVLAGALVGAGTGFLSAAILTSGDTVDHSTIHGKTLICPFIQTDVLYVGDTIAFTPGDASVNVPYLYGTTGVFANGNINILNVNVRYKTPHL